MSRMWLNLTCSIFVFPIFKIQCTCTQQASSWTAVARSVFVCTSGIIYRVEFPVRFWIFTYTVLWCPYRPAGGNLCGITLTHIIVCDRGGGKIIKIERNRTKYKKKRKKRKKRSRWGVRPAEDIAPGARPRYTAADTQKRVCCAWCVRSKLSSSLGAVEKVLRPA